MANEPVPVIEADGVGTLQPRHVGNQIGVGRFELQVVMVAHQAVGVNLPIRFLARFRQRFEKILPVHILQENSLAPVALAHDVRHRRRILDSHLAWHQAISCGMPPHKSSQNHTFLWIDPFFHGPLHQKHAAGAGRPLPQSSPRKTPTSAPVLNHSLKGIILHVSHR